MDEKELEKLRSSVEDLKEELDLKEQLFKLEDSFNAYTQGRINNIKKKIQALEIDYKKIKELFQTQPNVLINFRKRATEIQKEIDSLE